MPPVRLVSCNRCGNRQDAFPRHIPPHGREVCSRVSLFPQCHSNIRSCFQGSLAIWFPVINALSSPFEDELKSDPFFLKLSQLLRPIIVLPFSEFLQQECLLSAEHLVRVNPWATEPGIVGRFEIEAHRIPESHRNNVVIRGEAYKQRDTMGYTGVNMYEREV